MGLITSFDDQPLHGALNVSGYCHGRGSTSFDSIIDIRETGASSFSSGGQFCDLKRLNISSAQVKAFSSPKICFIHSLFRVCYYYLCLPHFHNVNTHQFQSQTLLQCNIWQVITLGPVPQCPVMGGTQVWSFSTESLCILQHILLHVGMNLQHLLVDDSLQTKVCLSLDFSAA